MFVHIREAQESAEYLVSRSTREERRRRNAEAHRKLEALRERKLLSKQLTDVWDEPANHS